MVSPQSGDSNVRQPEGESKFGKIFTQFYHNAKDAISKLKQEKSGDAVGALYHPEVGDIDLVWGNEGTAEQDYKDGMGLAKIAIKHPEVIDSLQDIISSMQVIPEKERTGYMHLESKDHVAKVRLDWNRESKKWLLTAYEKGARRGTTADTAEQSSEDDTARLTSSPNLNIRQPTAESKPADPMAQMAASVESLAKSVQTLAENQTNPNVSKKSENVDTSKERDKKEEKNIHEGVHGESVAKLKYAKPSTIETPAQGVLNQTREGKAKAFEQAKALRDRIRHEPLGGNRSGLRIELLKAEGLHREYQRAEKEALDAIEKRANELGLTTIKANAQDGDVRLSLVGSTKDRRISFADASAIVDKIALIAKKDWNLDIILVTSHDALPENVKAAIAKDYGKDTKAKGVVHNGIAYIVADEHTSQADVEETILHEIKGHVGIRHAPLLSPRTLRGYQRPAPLTRFHHQVHG